GQSGGGPATETTPVNAGVLIEDGVVTVDGNEVFSEDWTMVPLANELGDWTNAWTESTARTWQDTAPGSLLQTSNFGPATTSTSAFPRGDADGPIILAPVTGLTNFFLELGFHPFDDDGMGFVYDFQDTNNYSRVLFVSEPSGPGRVPQGLTVSRKSDGMWSD